MTEWLTSPKDLSLKGNEVHVWRVPLDMPDVRIEKLFEVLSQEEKIRSARYHFSRDQKHFVAARGILRNILARYLAAEPEQIVFSYDSRGKPFLCDTFNNKEISFNLSHAHDLALYAVAVKRKVGIDVESVQQDFQWEEIVERFFSSVEQAELWTLPVKDRLRAFYTYWTRKEAILKAMGTCLTDEMREINGASEPLKSTCLSRAGYPRNGYAHWTLIDLDTGPRYASALAVEGRDWKLRCYIYSPE